MTTKRLWNRLRGRRPLKVLNLTAPTSDVPTLPAEFFEPRKQPWYTFNGQAWEPAELEDAVSATTTARLFQADRRLCKLRAVTWNLEGIAWTFAQPRMESTLNYLKTLVGDEREAPAIIMLQEMTDINIDVVKSSPWIQERFAITDLDASRFDSTYGVITLVDKRVPVIDVFRVRWPSRFGRDGLFVDVRFPMSDNDGNSGEVDKQAALATLRFCNTHLESLHSDPPVRPIQVRRANPYLHTQEVHGAILAGDMNAHGPADGNIPSDNHLNDVYLDLGGAEDDEDGFTWGYQSSRPVPQDRGKRLDKVLCCGSLVARKIKRIGVGVVVEDDYVREKMRKTGGDGWLSDHYGLMTEFEIMDKTG